MYFRRQDPGLTLNQMQSFKSFLDVDPETGDDIIADGVCVIDNAYTTNFGGSCADEVVVLEGNVIEEIYDGLVIFPTKIVARFSYEKWCEMIEAGETEQYDE